MLILDCVCTTLPLVSIAVALYAVVSMDVVRRFLYAKRQGYEPIADIEQSS